LMEQLFFKKENMSKPIYELSVKLKSDMIEEKSNLDSVYCCDYVSFAKTITNVAKCNDTTAIMYGDLSLSYKQLYDRASFVAHVLKNSYGVCQQHVIIQAVERSLDMVIGMIAIQLLGCIYCPFDPEHPLERLKNLAQATDCKLILICNTYKKLNDIQQSEAGLIFLDIQTLITTSYSSILFTSVANPEKDDIAYFVPTSGSTGAPKIVSIKQESLCNLQNIAVNSLYWKAGDVVLQLTKCSFDVHIMEIYCSLQLQCPIVMLKPHTTLDLIYLLDTIETQAVVRIMTVPSLLLEVIRFCDGNYNYTNQMRSVKSIVVGGEALFSNVVAESHRVFDWIIIINAYGPAECTVVSTTYVCNKIENCINMPIPIGTPVLNYKCMILDEYLQPVPVNTIGELYIGGVGVMKGYLNDSKTADVLIDVRCREQYYKTGDLVRMQSDGNFVFVGRNDLQVKINGQRVETGEIETAIKLVSEIEEAVVCINKVANDIRVVAYVVADNKQVDKRALLKLILIACNKTLPKYMIPTELYLIDQFPVNENGKIDRRKLLDQDNSHHKLQIDNNDRTQPRSKLEHIVFNIWAEVLGRCDFGIYSDFFSDAKANPLKAMLVLARINQTMGAYNSSNYDKLFAVPTIAAMASILNSLEQQSSNEYYDWTPLNLKDAPASHQQKRYMNSLSNANIVQIYDLNIENNLINLDVLHNTLYHVVRRHDIFRTYLYENNKKEIRQMIVPIEQMRIKVHLEVNSPYDAFINEKNKAFNLLHEPNMLNDPTIRLTVVLDEWGEQTNLIMTVHHAACDGWCTELVQNEISNIYSLVEGGLYTNEEIDQRLPLSNKLSYADYCHYYKQFSTSSIYMKQYQFWKHQYTVEKRNTRLALPFDDKLSKSSNKAVTVYSTFGTEYKQAISKFSTKFAVTQYQLLMATYFIFLYAISGVSKITIGGNVANRFRPELESVVGSFNHHVTYQSHVDVGLTFQEYLLTLKQEAQMVLSNSYITLDAIVKRMMKESYTFDGPLYNVYFGFQDFAIHTWKLGATEANLHLYPHHLTFKDFSLAIRDLDNPLSSSFLCEFRYPHNKFQENTIQGIVQVWNNIMQRLYIDEYCDNDSQMFSYISKSF